MLLRHLLAHYSRAVLVDPKGRAVMDGWPILAGSGAFTRAWPATPRAVVRLGPGEDRRGWLDAIAWHVYRHGESAFALDETRGLVDSNRRSLGLDAILTQGRELGITALVCTQRPVRIPPELISEADRFAVFSLQRADDVAAIAEVIGDYPQPRFGTFRYAYWDAALDRPIECAALETSAVPRRPPPDSGDQSS